MECSRTPWRLLSILCILALCLPATPTILPTGPAVSASAAASEAPLVAPAEAGLGAPAASRPPAGTLYTVNDNPVYSAATADGDQASPAAQSEEGTDSVPEEIAGTPGVTSDWWDSVQEQILQDMYTLSSEGGQDGILSYRGHNLALGLDLTFVGGGVGLAPAQPAPDPRRGGQTDPADAEGVAAGGGDAEPEWTWDLALAGFGYKGDVRSIPDPIETVVTDNRIEYQRDGITEWYANDKHGLTQGFVIALAPSAPSSGSLVLEMTVESDLVATLAQDRQTVDFGLPGSTTNPLQFTGVSAIDAAGHELPAYLALIEEGIAVSVDDSDAAYPVSVALQVAGTPWSAFGEDAGHRFGARVGSAGDVNGDGFADILVHASGYDSYRGKVYVWHGSPQGPGTYASWWKEGEGQDNFFGDGGTAGDVNGDGYADLILGGPGYDNWRGKAYVWYGGPSGLGTGAADWSRTGAGGDDLYGIGLGTAGDVNGDGFDDVVVGAGGHGSDDQGRIYLYLGSSSGLGDASWTQDGLYDNEGLGWMAETAGDVNGDGYDDVAAGGGKMQVYVFYGSRSGLGGADWSALEENDGDFFGDSLGTAGDVNGDGYDDLIVGAFGYGDNAGRAYIYHGAEMGLGGSPAWTYTGQPGEAVGDAAGTAGDMNGDGYADVIVGAPTANSRRGVAHIFYGSEAGVASVPDVTRTGVNAGSGGTGGDLLGGAVALAGDVNGDGYDDVIVGAHGYEGPDGYATGKAWVYYGAESEDRWTATGDDATAYLGWSAGPAGDVNADGFADLIVGAYGHSQSVGRAYLFRGSSTGLGTSPDWVASGEAAGDQFGYAAMAAGDVNGDGFHDVVVGAPGFASRGKTYVFHGSEGGLGAAPAWSGLGENADDGYGSTVGTAGDVDGDGYDDLLIGAEGYAGGNEHGKAYLYPGSETGLAPAATWTASGEQAGSHFGHALGTAGDLNADGYADVVVGAYGYDGLAGRVYVFHGSSTGLGASADWTATGSAGDSLGESVATAGDVDGDGYADLAAGAPTHDSNKGQVHVYHGAATGLAGSTWQATGQNAMDGFGDSLGTAGDVNGDGYADLIIGASNYVSRGRAYLYQGSGTGLGGSAGWSTIGQNVGDHFGSAVGTAGDVDGDGFSDLVIGAWGSDEPEAANTGKVYVSRGTAGGIHSTPTWTPIGQSAGDYFACSLATAGDLNGDGYSDLVVGARGFDSETGKVYVYYGGSTGLPVGQADWTATGEAAGDQFGRSIATAGDVNGDGYADLIVGAFHHNGVVGKAYVYHGGPSGLTMDPADWDWAASGEAAGDWYGWSVGTAGDVNGDGYADVVVGAYQHDSDSGKAYVYHGGPGGLTTGPADWTATGEEINNYFGGSVGTAGDVNGDGYADLVVGAIRFYAFRGRVYVFHGGPSGLAEGAADWTADGETIGDSFGQSVGTAGDVNGDGYADVIVGAYNHGGNGEGKAYVFHGTARGLDTPFSQLEAGSSARRFGYALGTAGDVNGDGYADVVVGAPGTGTIAGRAFVYRGSSEGVVPAPAWESSAEQAGDYHGWSVATAGDVNGDGYADLVVSADAFDGDWGKAYLFEGDGGRQSAARQARGDGSNTPVQPWGVSHNPDGFQISLQAPHPLGRGSARLQIQACAPGVRFGEAACRDQTTEPWRTASGAIGTNLTTVVDGLDRGTLYRWRARALFKSPLAIHGPWRRLQSQALEADIRNMELPTDLVITKSVNPTQPVEGQPIEYTLNFYADKGPASGVVITDIVPSDISSVSVVSSGVAITDTGASPGYVWQVQDLVPGQVGTITISGVAEVARFVNTAVISSTTTELDPANNTASVQTHVPGLIYVNGDNPGPVFNGNSWDTAYVDLQDALDAANTGDEIWVAEGVYRPANVGGRPATFQLIEDVEVYGGFAGDETWRHERDWAAHPTVLSGDIGTEGNNSDNAYHVVTGSGVTAAAVLDGFIVAGGNADGADSAGQGGGIYNDGGSPMLYNLTFAGNSAGSGGGMFNANSSTPLLIDVAFSGNSATGSGGGIHNASGSSPTLINVTFSLNTAGAPGGAIHCEAGTSASVSNSILWGNSPDQIYEASSGLVTVSYSDVEGSWPGTSNLDADPVFYDANGLDDTPGTLDDDLRLRHMSPVIDWGDDSALPADTRDLDGDGDTSEALPLDLSGRRRVIGFTTTTPQVDMGAYEANILDVIAEADGLFAMGRRFRLEELQILPSDTMAQALQNYQDFNDGALFYDFCADHGSVDADGYCPDDPDRKNVRNTLLDGIELYRVALNYPSADFVTHDGETIPVVEIGGTGAVSSAEEMANVHLVFGNEFLVDAIDFRFSLEGIPYADEIIAKELAELEQARQQFTLTIDLLFRLLAPGEWGAGPYFETGHFETFGVSSNRLITTLNEMASRYRMQGNDAGALALYDSAYEEQYLQLTALADLANTLDAQYLADGSWEMFNTLSMMRERAQSIRDGLDFFGFAQDYVPLQSYDQLLELVDGPTGNTGLLGTARDLEDQARAAQRQFDKNSAELNKEVKQLQISYNRKLFDLCGPSEDNDGDGFYDYDPCESGLMGRNRIDLDAAALRVALAWEKAQNIGQKIQIEQQRAAETIQIDLGLASRVAAITLETAKLSAFKVTESFGMGSELKVSAGFKMGHEFYQINKTKISKTGPTPEIEIGQKASAGLYAGFETSTKVATAVNHSFTPNVLEIGEWNSIKALEAAEAKAEISGANSAAKVRNLLLAQSEALLNYEIAMQGYAKVVNEHNMLAAKYNKYLNKRTQAKDKVASYNPHLLSPAYRILRDSLTIQSADAIELAAQFAYLTAKAAEYELLTPYPNLHKIFGARTSNDIRLFLDDLGIWYQALNRPGQLNRYPYTLSIARDVMGLTDEALDPNGKLTSDALGSLRFKHFQKEIRAATGKDGLELAFTTSLGQTRPGGQYLFSPNIWNNRIAGIGTPLAQNEGISANIVTRQGGDVGTPELVLVHDGQTSYRTAANAIVNLDPDTAVPVGYVLPEELDPESTTVVLRPGINGAGAVANSGLVNQSVAASAWTLLIPVDSKGNLDLNLIADIEIRLDATGRALPDRSLQAAEDAQRLQAGLELQPQPDVEPSPLALGWTRAPAAAAPRLLLPSEPDGMGGSYTGRVVVSSPVTIAVQVLNLDIVNQSGVLGGSVVFSDTALYNEPVGVQGTTDGKTFVLISDVTTNTVAGRAVTRQFTLEGDVLEGGDILEAAFTGTITGLLPTPVVERGRYLGSRPTVSGGPRLEVSAAEYVLAPKSSTTVSTTLLSALMEPMSGKHRVEFKTDNGKVKPRTVDTVDGVALATFTAPDSEGEAIIVATTGEVTGTVRIEIQGSASPDTDWELYLPAVANDYDTALYDDFEDAAFDNGFNPALWASAGNPDFDIRQWSGSLLFGSATAPGNSGAELYLSQPPQRSLREIQEFEAKLKFSAGHDSGYASVKIQVSMDESGGKGWWTQCTLAAQDRMAPGFLCDVSTYDSTSRRSEYLTPIVPVAFDTWYTAKIEADPNTAELSFYLDGALVGTHTPSNAATLLGAGNLHPKVGVWNGTAGTTATRYVDQVRITPAGH